MDITPHSVILALIVTSMACAFDLSKGLIPNALIYPTWLFAIVLFMLGYGLSSWVDLSMALALGFVPAAVLFSFGLLGGGDVKLLALLATLLGYSSTFNLLIFAVGFACVLSLGVILWSRRAGTFLKDCFGLLKDIYYQTGVVDVRVSDVRVPFALPVFAALLVILAYPKFSILELM
jgi:prepilin peptidase CpaA